MQPVRFHHQETQRRGWRFVQGWGAGTGINVAKGEIKNDEFKLAYEAGRAAKYHLDANWESDMIVYVQYGQAGGSRKDKAKTDEIMEASRKEMAHDKHAIQLMLGDFNVEPNSLDVSKELFEEEQWIDVGEKARWWGGTANEKTCQTRPQAKPTRIDGILASREAVVWIKKFEVERDDMIPTHSVLKLYLQRGAAAE